MNFARTLIFSAACSLALVASTTGCNPKTPPGTNPPGETGPTASNDGGGDDGGAGGDDGGAGGDDGGAAGGDGGSAPAAKCEAKTADAPTPLFGERVLIRPPVGVEFMMDDNPTFAQAQMSGGFVSACDATVKRVLMFVFENDKKKGLDKYTAEFLETLTQQGYQNGKQGAPAVDSKTDHHVVVEYPAGAGNPASNLYVVSARRFDNVFIVVYEADPPDFKALQPTFKASAESLLVIPPDA